MMKHTTAHAKPRTTKFQSSHAIIYGLKIMETDEYTKLIKSVSCRFCSIFGHEPMSGVKRQRQQTERTWSWTGPPFHAENFNSHHETQHSLTWERYQALSHAEKVKFFDVKIRSEDTLHRFFGDMSTSLHFTIDSNIIDVIIGDMLFHPDDHNGVTHANALKLFEKTPLGNYEVNIANSMQFRLVIRMISRGISLITTVLWPRLLIPSNRTPNSRCQDGDRCYATWIRTRLDCRQLRPTCVRSQSPKTIRCPSKRFNVGFCLGKRCIYTLWKVLLR